MTEQIRDRLIDLRAGVLEGGVFGATEGLALLDILLDSMDRATPVSLEPVDTPAPGADVKASDAPSTDADVSVAHHSV